MYIYIVFLYILQYTYLQISFSSHHRCFHLRKHAPWLLRDPFGAPAIVVKIFEDMSPVAAKKRPFGDGSYYFIAPISWITNSDRKHIWL